MLGQETTVEQLKQQAPLLFEECVDHLKRNQFTHCKQIIKQYERKFAPIIEEMYTKHSSDNMEEEQDESADEDESLVLELDFVNFQDGKNESKSLLHLIVEKEDSHNDECDALLNQLLELKRIQITEQFDVRGMNPLHVAVLHNKRNAIRLLVEKGNADINSKCVANPYTGYTALHFACSSQMMHHVSNYQQVEKMIKLLCEELHANVNITTNDTEEDSPLHCLARSNFASCIELLLENGANLNCENKNGITPLMVACTLANEESVEKMLKLANKFKLNMNHVDHLHGDNAIFYSFQSKLQRVMEHGMEYSSSHENIAYMLALNGCDVNHRANDNHSVMDYCSEELGIILTLAFKYGPTILPHTLPSLLAQSGHKFEIEETELKRLHDAVSVFAAERSQVEEKLQSGGTCPISKGNRHILKRKGIITLQPNKQNAGSSSCPMGFTEKDGPNPHAKGKCPIPFHNHISKLLSAKGVAILCFIFLTIHFLLSNSR